MKINIVITIEQTRESIMPECVDALVEAIYAQTEIYQKDFPSAVVTVDSEAN